MPVCLCMRRREDQREREELFAVCRHTCIPLFAFFPYVTVVSRGRRLTGDGEYSHGQEDKETNS